MLLNKSNQNKMSKSVVMGVILYILTQMVTLLLIVIFGLFNKSVMNIVNTKDIINITTIDVTIHITADNTFDKYNLFLLTGNVWVRYDSSLYMFLVKC